MDAPHGLRLLTLALITVLLWCGTPAHAQMMWKDTRVGMSLQAVQQQFPKAIRPSAPTHLADGSRELLRLSGTVIQGHVFDALFFFKQGKLTQISLELKEKGGAVFGQQIFRSIKAAYDTKYGAPDEEQDRGFDTPTGPASFRSASWRSGRTWITLSYVTGAGRLVVLNVAYRLASARKADDI